MKKRETINKSENFQRELQIQDLNHNEIELSFENEILALNRRNTIQTGKKPVQNFYDK